ncbi:MAG: MATE family efflux transporter [Eubacteriales bacterium]
MAQNMTKGNPTKLLVEFMIPVLIGNLFQNLYGIVDSMVVGRYLGVDALAAVGSVGIVTFGVQGLAIGMTSGFGIIFSQCYGGQKESELRHHIAVAAYVSVMFSVLMTGILLGYLPLLLELMNIPQEIYGETELYTRIFFWGFGACVAYNFFSAAARAVGDSRTPLYFLIFSSVLNVILDIVLIRDFGMGVDGAAVATVASQLLSGILCGIYVFARYSMLRVRKGEWAFRVKSAGSLLKMGIPMALQFFITALGGMILQSTLNRLGAAAIAAYAAAQRVGQVIQQPGVAIGTALATYVGQNTGAGEIERIRQGVRKAITMTILIFGVLMIVCFFAGEYTGLLFLSEPNRDVQMYLNMYFHIATLFFIPLGLIFVYRNALQGLGDGVFPMLGGVFELLGRLLVVGTIGTKLGFFGICFGDPATWTIALVPLIPVYYYRLTKLQKKIGGEVEWQR